MTTKTKTVRDWLEELANTDTSSEQDSAKLQHLLHKLGFPDAVVVMGIVYLEGHGTIDAPPASIHSVARMILDAHKGES